MALYYHTEYRLGRRARIHRSYTGLRALVAIFFDLIFGLIFEFLSTFIVLSLRMVVLAAQLAAQVLKTAGKVLVAALTALVFILTLPFAVLHQAVDRLGSRRNGLQHEASRGSIVKPDWALGREL
jgi:hypothetical protein